MRGYGEHTQSSRTGWPLTGALLSRNGLSVSAGDDSVESLGVTSAVDALAGSFFWLGLSGPIPLFGLTPLILPRVSRPSIELRTRLRWSFPPPLCRTHIFTWQRGSHCVSTYLCTYLRYASTSLDCSRITRQRGGLGNLTLDNFQDSLAPCTPKSINAGWWME